MYTPNTPYEEMETVLPEWHEPFPEPQTIPVRLGFERSSIGIYAWFQ